MKNEKHLYKIIHKTLRAFLILFIFYIAAAPESTLALPGNSVYSESETSNQDDFDKKFREGRDLIDREEWARGAEKFREVIEKYPGGKSVDAAYYWLAFCHKKQKQFKEADAALDRLLEEFPASSWAIDARVMKLEIAAPLGKFYSSNVPSLSPGASTITSPANVVKGTSVTALTEYYKSLPSGEVYAAAARVPLDREDEIKIAAFQSLLSADPKRAIETMGEILKPGSKASETLKQEALRVLQSPRLTATQTMLFTATGGGIAKEFVPLLRETLVKSFQNETNLKIRKEIIYALGNLSDPPATDHLKKVYAAETDREIKKAIINSFGAPANRLHNFDSNAAPKHAIEMDFLLEIIGAEKEIELRRLAFSNLQRFQGWAASEQTIDVLARLYDSEADEAFKISIIRAFSSAKQPAATRKLLDIAKTDKSDKLRLEAIYSLRTSKNPEVLKFLEDLIK